MQRSQVLSLAGATIGIVTIVLGIVALSTSTWIILTAPGLIKTTYSLFERCTVSLNPLTVPLAGCIDLKDGETAQGLTIAGFVIAGFGIIVSILLGVLVNNRWIKMMPQVLLIIGPTLIIIGAVYYVKNVLTDFTSGDAELDLGYSFILIVVTCIVGYISAAYFLFVAGFAHGYHRGRLSVSPVF